MDIYKLMQALQVADGPNRKTDDALALYAGYRMEIERNGDHAVKVWYAPGTSTPVRRPTFTATVDHAVQFANLVDAYHVGALVKDESGWRAQVEDGQQCRGATPAIALCLAVLDKLSRR
jgi:hypothetical protein